LNGRNVTLEAVKKSSQVYERVAWETEGLLIACWLALQDGVEEVEYRPSGVYRLGRMGVEGELQQFFYHHESFVGVPA
jgi:hypothetical protein